MERKLAREYPDLFGPVTWGPVQCRFALLGDEPPAHLVSNISIVPFVGSRAVQLELEDGSLEIIGGTLEPGESYREAIERELVEEAGARLLRLEPFGVWHCHSTAPTAYRPHIPHPDFYRLVAWAEVEIVGLPQVPEGGERVRQVHLLAVEEAAAAFRAHGRAELAELYLLAERVRLEE
ncbi:MAG TPA: NUDIX domain-containing protein [Chloroflexia bacterium]|nr:NUDIX domain-containing protein [Chloroflexia bacterium]